jgi:hypothetical protein
MHQSTPQQETARMWPSSWILRQAVSIRASSQLWKRTATTARKSASESRLRNSRRQRSLILIPRST